MRSSMITSGRGVVAGEAPSKMDLLERREERRLVVEGKTVLEERRDLLAQAMIEAIAEAERAHGDVARQLAEARGWLRHAMLRHGLYGLHRFARPGRWPDPPWVERRRVGTAVLEPGSVAEDSQTPALGSGWEVSLELEQLVSAMHVLVELLRRLAVLENNLIRLTAAFRRTQRRVNALEHIVLPELDAAIRNVEAMLEEADRENLVRSLMVKRLRQAW